MAERLMDGRPDGRPADDPSAGSAILPMDAFRSLKSAQVRRAPRGKAEGFSKILKSLKYFRFRLFGIPLFVKNSA